MKPFVLCCRSDKDLVNQERSLAMFRDDSKSAGSRNREVGHTHTHTHSIYILNNIGFEPQNKNHFNLKGVT